MMGVEDMLKYREQIIRESNHAEHELARLRDEDENLTRHIDNLTRDHDHLSNDRNQIADDLRRLQS